MIQNYICEKCNHRFVCKKIDTLEKFNSDSKKYIQVDITIDNCLDYIDSDGERNEKE